MKSRVQLAGVPHGSREHVLWTGDLPVISGIPGMRITFIKDSPDAYTFKQVCLEICGEDVEQVIYVIPVDRTKISRE